MNGTAGPIKLYVGNVPTSARNSELMELFEKFGKVVECDILKEFAFVHMESDNDAKAAIAGLNDSLWKGSRVRVEISTTKTSKGEPAAKRDFNGRGGGRGGFAGGDRGRGGHRGGGGGHFDRNGGGGGGGGGHFDRNRGGQGGFQDRNSGGGGGGMMRNGGFGGQRGGFGDRGGRGRGGDGRGDARTMSRGGYGDRFGAPQQRRENGGGGPMRDNRFNGGGSNYGRPYPDQQFNGGPRGAGGPMRGGDYGSHGDGYGMRPPMSNGNSNGNSNGFGNGGGPPPHQDFYGNGQQLPTGGMGHFNGQSGRAGYGNGVGGGGGDHYMHGSRAPIGGGGGAPMGGAPPMGHGPPNNFNFQQAPNSTPNGGQPQRFNNNFDSNGPAHFNGGPPRQQPQRFNNY